MTEPTLASEKLQQDPRIQQARKLLMEAVAEHQQTIRDVRPPDPELAARHQQRLTDFGKLRGNNLYFPYLGSGLGNGPFVELEDGSVKLDFITGIGVHGYGHSHPLVVSAGIEAALSDTVMQGNLQQNSDSYRLSRLLVDTACESGAKLEHCLLSTSGAMANENSLKIAYQKNHPANRIISFSHCFAGRTLALCQVTDKAAYRQGMPDTIPVDYIPFYREDQPKKSIETAVNHFHYLLKRNPGKYAAFWMELVQGEGGYYPGTKEFFLPLLELAKDHKIAVIADEVQTFCRTTRPFAFQHFQLDEYIDIVTIGKISQACATLFTPEYNPRPGLISQTFTSSSFSIIAGHAIVNDLIQAGNFGEQGRNQQIHQRFRHQLEEIARRHPGSITGPFGIGGMIGFTPFDGSEGAAKDLVNGLYHAGLMSFMAGGNPSRVRFLVPLGCTTDQHIDLACSLLEKVIAQLKTNY
jgi:acetylornithine/N-succinyldiaminopimelate aminotransferase